MTVLSKVISRAVKIKILRHWFDVNCLSFMIGTSYL